MLPGFIYSKFSPFHFVVLSVFFVISSNVRSQEADLQEEDSHRIELLDQQIVDRGRGITQLYLLSEEDLIHNMGVAETIVKPGGLADSKVGYFRIYFTGRKGKIEKWIFVLVADFDSEEPRFFIDQNGNLDFTDDKSAKPIECGDGAYIFEIFGEHKDSKFSIKLMPFRHDEDITDEAKDRYVQLFDGLREAMGGKFANVDFWFYDRRLNTRTNSVNVDGQEVMLGVHDYDCDGLYHGERDRLLVGEFGAKNISYQLADGAVALAKDAVFLIGDQPYRILEVAADGSHVRIVKSNVMPDRLFVGMPVPNFTLKQFDGNSVEVRSLLQPKKLLVLDFWGQWCAPCVEAIPSTIEFREKWKERIVMAGVHMGDHGIARRISAEKEVPWPQFEYADEVGEILFIDAWPTYVVIDENGKLVSFNSSLKEIAEMLEE